MENENRLGIEDPQKLAEEEERIAKFRALELYDSEDFDLMETGTYQCLSLIHRYLLDEVYESAGEARTTSVPESEVPFIPILLLRTAIVRISTMPQSTFEQILEKYVEMKMVNIDDIVVATLQIDVLVGVNRYERLSGYVKPDFFAHFSRHRLGRRLSRQDAATGDFPPASSPMLVQRTLRDEHTPLHVLDDS